VFVSVLECGSFDDAASMSDCITWNDEMSSEQCIVHVKGSGRANRELYSSRPE
jgi:hypothetical protein